MSDIVDAHLEWMRRERYSPRAINDRRRLLRHAARNLPEGLDDVYSSDLETYLNNRRWSAWTKHTYAEHLAGFYGWGHQVGEFDDNPMLDIPIPPKGAALPKPVPIEEVRIALERSEGMWLTAVMLALFAGLRSSEIADCHREHITPDDVHVLCGKGGKERFVDTSRTLWTHVASLPRGPLVVRPGGRPVTGPWLSCHQQVHWQGIGLPHVHLHRLRHTFCTEMLDQGNDSMVIRDMMGHASALTTQGYAGIKRTARRRAIESLDALIGHEPASNRLVPSSAEAA